MKPPDDHAPNPGKHRLESDQIADACLIQTAPIVDHQDVAAVGARQGFKDRRECKVSLALGGSRSSWFYSPVMAAPLQFWFDLASTYSYVAALRIERACASTSVPLVWKPFLLGPIFSQQLGISDSPFNANPVRGRYMWRDLERLCAKYGLSWRRPSVFPRNSVLAARVACAGATEGWEPQFVRAAFCANFAEAMQIGIFGAPSYVVSGELFFGQDRLEDAVGWASQ